MSDGSSSPPCPGSHSAAWSRPATGCGEARVHTIHVIVFVLALALLVYLGYALLRAERF